LKATTTGHARGFSEGDIHIGGDHGLGTPEFDSQRVIRGQLGTRSNTPAAEDATIVIHDEIFPRSIHGEFWVRILIEPVIQTVPIGKGLKLAISTHFTEHAVVVSLREEHLENEFPLLHDLGRFGLDFHSLGNGKGTGRLERSLSFDLYETHSTSTMRGNRRMMA
jgi:hypothetical protein